LKIAGAAVPAIELHREWLSLQAAFRFKADYPHNESWRELEMCEIQGIRTAT
jgi:hypothetical protein